MLSRGRRTAVLILALAAGLVAAAPAAATFPGGDGKIFFVSDRDGNFEIYSMDADGSDETNLTNNAASDGMALGFTDHYAWDGPSVSPDGKKVAFSSTRSGNADIWVMDADGSNPTQLTNDAAADYMPAFTADGRIAFVSARDAPMVSEPNMWVMDADGGNETRLEGASGGNSGMYQPDTLPPGTPLAFAGTLPVGPNPQSVLGVFVPGSNVQGFNSPDTIPEMAPEWGVTTGLQLVVLYGAIPTTSFDIFQAELGADGTNLTSTPTDHETEPALSPTGQTIAYSKQTAGTGDWEINLIALNPIGDTPLTDNTANDVAPEWQSTDITPPDTTIDTNPGAATADTTPTFTFSSEAGATFECTVFPAGGSPAFGPCSGAGTHTLAIALPDGDYTFSVRATDTAGNTDLDPATFDFTVDSTGPVVDITKPPKRKIETRKARVKVKIPWIASEAESTFKCKLDKGAAKPCQSPKSYRVKVGKHLVVITATDQLGNVGPGKRVRFRVIETE